MGNYRRITCSLGHLHRFVGLGQGSDLVHFDQDAVANFLINSLLQTFGVGDKQVVTDDLELVAQRRGHALEAVPHAGRDLHERVVIRTQEDLGDSPEDAPLWVGISSMTGRQIHWGLQAAQIVRDEHGGAIDPEGLLEIESNIPDSEDDVKRMSLAEAEERRRKRDELLARYQKMATYYEPVPGEYPRVRAINASTWAIQAPT